MEISKHCVLLTNNVKTIFVKMHSFGETIRRYRHDRGLPLRKVAAYLDIDQGLLSKMERGLRKPNRELVKKFAKYYEVDENELLVSWLSDKVIYELAGEEDPSTILRLAEEKIAYQRETENARAQIIKRCKGVLAGYPAVRKAWLFGSYARRDNTASSDIDILIDVPKSVSFTLFDIADMKEELTRVCGREVDVVMERALKTGVRERVSDEMILLYEKE